MTIKFPDVPDPAELKEAIGNGEIVAKIVAPDDIAHKMLAGPGTVFLYLGDVCIASIGDIAILKVLLPDLVTVDGGLK